MKRNYIKPETETVCTAGGCILAAASRPTPPTGWYYDDNGELVKIPSDPSNPDPDADEAKGMTWSLPNNVWNE